MTAHDQDVGVLMQFIRTRRASRGPKRREAITALLNLISRLQAKHTQEILQTQSRLLSILKIRNARAGELHAALREIDNLPLDADITDAHNITARVLHRSDIADVTWTPLSGDEVLHTVPESSKRLVTDAEASWWRDLPSRPGDSGFITRLLDTREALIGALRAEHLGDNWNPERHLADPFNCKTCALLEQLRGES